MKKMKEFGIEAIRTDSGQLNKTEKKELGLDSCSEYFNYSHTWYEVTILGWYTIYIPKTLAGFLNKEKLSLKEEKTENIKKVLPCLNFMIAELNKLTDKRCSLVTIIKEYRKQVTTYDPIDRAMFEDCVRHLISTEKGEPLVLSEADLIQTKANFLRSLSKEQCENLDLSSMDKRSFEQQLLKEVKKTENIASLISHYKENIELGILDHLRNPTIDRLTNLFSPSYNNLKEKYINILQERAMNLLLTDEPRASEEIRELENTIFLGKHTKNGVSPTRSQEFNQSNSYNMEIENKSTDKGRRASH